MINLLPPDTRQNILYARKNRHLFRWVVTLLISIFAIGVVAVLGQLYINRSVASYTKQVQQSREQLKVQKLEETQKRVEDITGSLKLVLQVLSREILFSKLIRQIGAAMPANTVLTNLQIGKVEGGIDLDAVSVDERAGSQIQVNLADPANKIFDKADIISITCTQPTASVSNLPAAQQFTVRYPCQIKIRALFTKNNPFVFINNTSPSAIGSTP